MSAVQYRKKNKLAFGSSTVRFGTIGYHPGLDVTGTSSARKSSLGPGQYNQYKYERFYKNSKTSGSSWARKIATEEFSKYRGFRNPDFLAEKSHEEMQRGPGNYNISGNCFISCRRLKDNLSFGRSKREINSVKHKNPPPGTYSLNKYSPLERKQFTNVPSFEWDGFVDRFKSSKGEGTLAPNRYSIKDDRTIAGLLEKVVSKRGPYDLFTGPRDETTIKNHFAPPTFKGPVNIFNDYPTELEILLHHPRNKRYGRILRERRFGRPTLRNMVSDPSLCYRNPDFPGPSTYTIEPEKLIKQNKYAFNKSVLYAVPPIKWQIVPGVGRYSPNVKKCSLRIKHQSWMFKSKVKRSIPINFY